MARDAVSEIREKLDIVDIIGEKVVLKKAGRNMKGLCPFHQEKTPSFVVFPETQGFHCFGCGKGGDLFTFYMEREGVDFREALKELAERAGVSLDELPRQQKQADPREASFYDLHEVAASYFATVLNSSAAGEKGRRYLQERGISQEMIEEFRLGLAPDGWDYLLKQLSARGADPEAATDAGLLQRRDAGGYYDRFRDRIIFPILNSSGQVVGFGGRAFGDEQPKYLNSPQSPIFDKSSLLYGLTHARDAIREENRVVIVEGYMDVIAAHQHGFRNVVGAMGTALTETQVDLVKRLTKRVVLALDADAAGRMASVRAIESLQVGLDHVPDIVADPRTVFRIAQRLDAEVHIVELAAGDDPDSLIRSDPDSWDRQVESARPYMDFVIDHVLDSIDRNDLTARRRAIDQLGPFLQRIGDAVERSHYVQRLSRELDIPFPVVQSRIAQARTRTVSISLDPKSDEAAKGYPRTEDHLLALFLKYLPVVVDLSPQAPDTLLTDARNRELMGALRSTQIPPEWQPSVILEEVDSSLRDHGESILAGLPPLPPPTPGDVREELLQTVVKLQREQYEVFAGHLRAELATAQAEQDDETFSELRRYLEQLPELHQQLYPRRSTYFRDMRERQSKGS
ncbi:MAG: DNA primase [Thermomicrobiales bacterium]|nr:DNA primase [Thermomicrobiales bacterium]